MKKSFILSSKFYTTLPVCTLLLHSPLVDLPRGKNVKSINAIGVLQRRGIVSNVGASAASGGLLWVTGVLGVLFVQMLFIYPIAMGIIEHPFLPGVDLSEFYIPGQDPWNWDLLVRSELDMHAHNITGRLIGCRDFRNNTYWVPDSFSRLWLWQGIVHEWGNHGVEVLNAQRDDFLARFPSLEYSYEALYYHFNWFTQMTFFVDDPHYADFGAAGNNVREAIVMPLYNHLNQSSDLLRILNEQVTALYARADAEFIQDTLNVNIGNPDANVTGEGSGSGNGSENVAGEGSISELDDFAEDNVSEDADADGDEDSNVDSEL